MKFVRVLLVLTFLLTMGACSGSKAPAVGTPDWLWAAARDSYLAGDYEKATDHLLKIEKQGSNPYIERARAWRLLIEAGSSNAQVELAKAYADGWVNTRSEKLSYSRRKQEHLKEARRHAIDLFEGYGPIAQQLSDKPVVLEFPFPGGNAPGPASRRRAGWDRLRLRDRRRLRPRCRPRASLPGTGRGRRRPGRDSPLGHNERATARPDKVDRSGS